MIKLEDVSTAKMLEKFPSSAQIKLGDTKIEKALAKYYVRDYRQLKELINNDDPYFNIAFFKNWLSLIEENIDYANERGIKPIIFTFEMNGFGEIEPKSLKTTDKKAFCRNLVINNPIIGPSSKFKSIRELRIYEAKLLLSKVVAHKKTVVGKNAFLESYPIYSMVDEIKLVRAINFYEQQIYRQSFETNQTGINLFVLNKIDKMEIITEEIDDIVEYLVSNARECVWGELTFDQKRKLISAIKNKKNLENREILERLIVLITNYTTLSEIKDGVRQKTLDRFIVR